MSTLSTAFKPETSQPATIGLFLLGSALAATWVGVNLAFPGLAPTGIPSVVTRLGIHSLGPVDTYRIHRIMAASVTMA